MDRVDVDLVTNPRVPSRRETDGTPPEPLRQFSLEDGVDLIDQVRRVVVDEQGQPATEVVVDGDIVVVADHIGPRAESAGQVADTREMSVNDRTHCVGVERSRDLCAGGHARTIEHRRRQRHLRQGQPSHSAQSCRDEHVLQVPHWARMPRCPRTPSFCGSRSVTDEVGEGGDLREAECLGDGERRGVVRTCAPYRRDFALAQDGACLGRGCRGDALASVRLCDMHADIGELSSLWPSTRPGQR